MGYVVWLRVRIFGIPLRMTWYAKVAGYEMFTSALHIQIPFYVTPSYYMIHIYLLYFLWAASGKKQWSVKW